jgi:hypothetical protein
VKVKGVQFDDEEHPSEFTVSMTLDELALLYRLAGHLPPRAVIDAFGGQRWADALNALSDAGSILNMYYEDGPNDVIRRANLFAPSGDNP